MATKQETRLQTALVTGATSGIGRELARLFAQDGFRLVIVARHEEALRETAMMLKGEGSPEVITIARDLAEPNAPGEVYDETKRRGIDVNVLVNDAGVGEYGYFKNTDLEKELGIIRLNAEAVVHLTKLYLRDMLTADTGRILQVASVVSYQPTPLLAVYAATKAFVLSFTDALINELKGTGVTMTALVPGATDTDFFRKAGMEATASARNNPEDPKVVAKIGYEGLMNGDRHALAPGVSKKVLMSSVLPTSAITAMAREHMETEEVKAGR